MNPADWVDTATVPTRHLPPTVDGALPGLRALDAGARQAPLRIAR